MRSRGCEAETFEDPDTGVRVRRLTDYKGHHHHLYFTNPGWWDGGRRLLIGGDRDGATNLFSVDLVTDEIVQVTDFPPDRDPAFTILHASLNPRRDEAYLHRADAILAIDLRDGRTRTIAEVPAGFRATLGNVTADGRFVCTSFVEDLSARIDTDLLHGYVGFRETFEAKPESRLVAIDVDGGGTEVLFEDRAWINHVNTSPVHPHLLTFCHEGPWNLVGNRIWGFDLGGGEPWKIRPTAPDEAVGHEYWLADGETIGYHGHLPDGAVFGFVRYDDTGRDEARFPTPSHHFHSNTRDLIVGDGPQRGCHHVLLWRHDEAGFSAPKKLCLHRSSRHIQQTHVHPRFSPDGRHVVFTADARGYGDVYLAEVPEFGSLPDYEAPAR